MTRKEAISLIRSECESVAGSLMVDRRACEDIVRMIFDDFESRICKNCKFYKTYYCENNSALFEYCSNPQNVQIHDDPATHQETEYGMQINANFGCNRFKKWFAK